MSGQLNAATCTRKLLDLVVLRPIADCRLPDAISSRAQYELRAVDGLYRKTSIAELTKDAVTYEETGTTYPVDSDDPVQGPQRFPIKFLKTVNNLDGTVTKAFLHPHGKPDAWARQLRVSETGNAWGTPSARRHLYLPKNLPIQIFRQNGEWCTHTTDTLIVRTRVGGVPGLTGTGPWEMGRAIVDVCVVGAEGEIVLMSPPTAIWVYNIKSPVLAFAIANVKPRGGHWVIEEVILTPSLITPATASLSLATFAPNIATPRLITPATASLVITTYAPVVT